MWKPRVVIIAVGNPMAKPYSLIRFGAYFDFVCISSIFKQKSRSPPSWVRFRFLGFRYSEQRHAEGSDRLGGLLPFETLAEGNLVLSLSASAGTPMLVSAF